jgi:hypothetical protein
VKGVAHEVIISSDISFASLKQRLSGVLGVKPESLNLVWHTNVWTKATLSCALSSASELAKIIKFQQDLNDGAVKLTRGKIAEISVAHIPDPSVESEKSASKGKGAKKVCSLYLMLFTMLSMITGQEAQG